MPPPPGGPRWLWDERFAHERRVLFLLALFLFAGLALVTVLSVTKYLSIQKDESLYALSSSAGTVAPAASPHPVTQGALETAANLIGDNRIDEASVLLQDAEVVVARFQGIIAWKKGDMGTAARKFETALQVAPESVPDLVNLAGIHMLNGQPAASAKLLDSAAKLAPDDIYISNRFLLARLAAGDIAGVRNEVRTALESAPDTGLPRAAFAAAALEIKAGEYSKAANFLFAVQTRMPSHMFNSLLNESPFHECSNRFEFQPFFPYDRNSLPSGKKTGID